MQTSTSEKPCDICGDPGIIHVIVTCSRCHNSREHIYCMRPNLVEVPESWYCEACQLKKTNHNGTCHSGGPKRYCHEELQYSSKRQKGCDTKIGPSKVPSTRRGSQFKSTTRLLSRNFVPKKVETGKVKYLSPEDVNVPASKDKPKTPPLRGGRSPQMSSLGINHVATPKKTPVALVASAKSPLEKGRNYASPEINKPVTNCRLKASAPQKHNLSPPLSRVKSPLGSQCNFSISKSLKGSEIISRRDKIQISDAPRHSPLNKALVVYNAQENCKLKSASSGSRAGKVESSLSKNYACKVEPVNAIVCYREDGTSNAESSFKFGEESVPNPPAVKASWKGSFEILDLPRECYDGFQAYPPGRVSRKAYLVSKQMPSILHFILQPRLDVWPETFRKGSPSGSDIALYFWADDICRSSGKYNRLLELMEKQDLSMQSRLDGAELLIFTSRQLPAESQRIEKQFYLWGVFLSMKGRLSAPGSRGKKQAADLPVCCRISEGPMTVTHKDDDDEQVMDMEIDMEGGIELNNVDICLGKNSRAVIPKFHSDQLIEESTSGRHLQQQIKREQYDDLGYPGSSGAVSSLATASPLGSKSPHPPGFSNSSSLVKRSPIAPKVHDPPGFPKRV